MIIIQSPQSFFKFNAKDLFKLYFKNSFTKPNNRNDNEPKLKYSYLVCVKLLKLLLRFPLQVLIKIG